MQNLALSHSTKCIGPLAARVESRQLSTKAKDSFVLLFPSPAASSSSFSFSIWPKRMRRREGLRERRDNCMAANGPSGQFVACCLGHCQLDRK